MQAEEHRPGEARGEKAPALQYPAEAGVGSGGRGGCLEGPSGETTLACQSQDLGEPTESSKGAVMDTTPSPRPASPGLWPMGLGLCSRGATGQPF